MEGECKIPNFLSKVHVLDDYFSTVLPKSSQDLRNCCICVKSEDSDTVHLLTLQASRADFAKKFKSVLIFRKNEILDLLKYIRDINAIPAFNGINFGCTPAELIAIVAKMMGDVRGPARPPRRPPITASPQNLIGGTIRPLPPP